MSARAINLRINTTTDAMDTLQSMQRDKAEGKWRACEAQLLPDERQRKDSANCNHSSDSLPHQRHSAVSVRRLRKLSYCPFPPEAERREGFPPPHPLPSPYPVQLTRKECAQARPFSHFSRGKRKSISPLLEKEAELSPCRSQM